jgi:hypothetical protein
LGMCPRAPRITVSQRRRFRVRAAFFARVRLLLLLA